MRRSLVGFITAAFAAFALTACGGQGYSPSQSAAIAPPNAVPALVPASSPCNLSGTWFFHGSCIAGELTAKGGKYTLPDYQGIGFVATLGHNNAKGTLKFVLGDAIGGTDITGTRFGKTFPKYGKKCVDVNGVPTPCTGTQFVYVELVNKSPAGIFLSGTATIVVDDAGGFPGSASCYPAELTPKGWFADAAVGVPPSSNTQLKITIPGGSGFTIPAGALILAMVCQ